jgi:septal ring factor EnvC (AmiA/AmiB activator)
VDGKGDKSTVTLLVSKGYNNFISQATDEETVKRLKMFLNDFLNDAAAYNLRLAIKRQEEVVQQAEKDVRAEVKSGEDLAQEINRLQKRMEEAQQSRRKLEATLEDQKSKLNRLKESAPKS